MKTIYKYPLEITDSQLIEMPMNAEILHAGIDPQGTACVWAALETRNEYEQVKLLIVGTGNPIPETARKHLGSFVQPPFVWHVFLGENNQPSGR
jgi:hypothetical protein